MTEFISKLSPLMEQFKKYRKASQKWSRDSHYKMRAFDRHCNELYPENDKLTQKMVDSFFAKRPTETINSCRQCCYLVSEFIKYLQEREQTNVIVPERPRKRRNTYIPHAFSHEELSDFFEACDNLRYLPNRIDMKIRSMTAPVIFRLLYSTGMRTIEALSLRCEHVDLTEGVISIVGTKGYNEHYIVLHDSMLELMQQFNQKMDCIFPNREYFFVSKDNVRFNSSWLTDNFRIIWDSVNSSHATAYDLRHNYAIENINRWTNEGFNFYDKIAYLSKSMGHVTLESTKYYYSIVPNLSSIMMNQTNETFDWIVPEVNTDEEIY